MGLVRVEGGNQVGWWRVVGRVVECSICTIGDKVRVHAVAQMKCAMDA